MLDCSNFTFVHGPGELLVHAQLRGDSNLEYCLARRARQALIYLTVCTTVISHGWQHLVQRHKESENDLLEPRTPRGPLSEVGGGGGGVAKEMLVTRRKWHHTSTAYLNVVYLSPIIVFCVIFSQVAFFCASISDSIDWYSVKFQIWCDTLQIFLMYKWDAEYI